MASRNILTAVKDAPEEVVKALWQDDTLTSLDRAKALYYSMLFQRDHITEWLLCNFQTSIASAETLLNGTSKYMSYGELLLGQRKERPSETLLRAAIHARVPCNPQDMFSHLLDVGGWALVLDALEANCAVEPPGSLWCVEPGRLGAEYAELIAKHVDRGCSAFAELCMSHATHTRDLPLLRRAIAGASQSSRFAHRIRMLPYALRADWPEGLRMLLDPESLDVSSPSSRYILETAVRESRTSCLDVLLDLGMVWKAAAFWVAFLEGHVSVLDHVVEQGALGPAPFLIPEITFEHLRQSWLSGQRSAWAAKMAESSTLGGLLPACVVALVDAAEAGRLKLETRRWREPAYLLLKWWDQQSREYTLRGGNALATPPTSHHPYGNSTHLPEVQESIMRLAIVVTPEELKRADAIAFRICRGHASAAQQGRQGTDWKSRCISVLLHLSSPLVLAFVPAFSKFIAHLRR